MSHSDSGHTSVRTIDFEMPPKLFAGTAESYARYRAPYPDELLHDLRHRAGITGEGRLLDLACGPGRVALPLATCFSEVWAVDQEPEMVEVGRMHAKRQGLTNVRWIVGRAEEVEAQPSSFELITIGEAFHRLDQRLIAERATAWLAPGGGLATLGCFSLMQGQEPWHETLRAVIRPWTDHGATAQPAGTPLSPRPRGADHERQVLTAFGFEYVGTYGLPASLRLDAGFDPRESQFHLEFVGAGGGRRGRALRRRRATRVARLRRQRPIPGDAPLRLQPFQDAWKSELADLAAHRRVCCPVNGETHRARSDDSHVSARPKALCQFACRTPPTDTAHQ